MQPSALGRGLPVAVLLSCLGLAPPLLEAEASPPQYEISMAEVWIPMPDGVRLAADLYLPTGAEPDERFPVLLEYLPSAEKVSLLSGS